PGPRPTAAQAQWSAAVPVFSARQYSTPRYSAHSRCNAVISGAFAPQTTPLSSARSTASRSSSRMSGHRRCAPAGTVGAPPAIAGRSVVAIVDPPQESYALYQVAVEDQHRLAALVRAERVRPGRGALEHERPGETAASCSRDERCDVERPTPEPAPV